MSWLYEDMLLEEPPADIAALFPHAHRDADGALAHVPGVDLAEHLRTLEVSRSRFLELVTPMTPADWHTVREPPGTDYAASPAWIVYHLVEHEAGHLFQIREIVRRYRASPRP
jgi:hypothetical protein